jgi:hypothetical protein
MSTTEDPNAWMAQKLFDKLSGMGHKIYLYDGRGQRVYDPSQADRMFSHTAKMMVTLGYTKGKPAKPLVTFNTSDSTDPKMLLDVKDTLKQHNLYDHSFDTRPYGRTLEPKMFAHMNREHFTESTWTGSTRTSRWRTGLTEVVIRHSERLPDEQAARRWCKVRDIFIHAPDGTRYRMPVKHILGAKALAQHINQNGQAWDQAGDVIHHMMRVQQQCRKLRNWLQQHDADLMPMLDQMQNKIKLCLKHVSDEHHYSDTMPDVLNMVHTWKQQSPQTPAPCGESMQEAWQALCVESAMHVSACEPEASDPSQHTDHTWREQTELMEWFQQFGAIMELKAKDVKAAVISSQSEDPRELLAHLSDEVTGWESHWEQDPKLVLDKITKTLDKIKKVGA